MGEVTDAIISIRPNYAEAILDGSKTVELRRRLPNVNVGTRLWIYATRPTAAVIGTATIRNILRAHPRTIWRSHRSKAGVDHSTYAAYFDGAHVAVAIVLTAARRITPVSIDRMKQVRAAFHPPQVLSLLTPTEARILDRLAKTRLK